MKNRTYAVLAECPACDTDEDFQVFIPAYVPRRLASLQDPPLERWECTSCRTVLRATALRDIVDLEPKQ